MMMGATIHVQYFLLGSSVPSEAIFTVVGSYQDFSLTLQETVRDGFSKFSALIEKSSIMCQLVPTPPSAPENPNPS
jgi:hypothetical protein